MHICMEATGNYFVSTHSRPKAAGFDKYGVRVSLLVSTHSRPKAAGAVAQAAARKAAVSTHSRPKAAGVLTINKRQNSKFQHTAARRRLVSGQDASIFVDGVSTHSRPKAAGGEAGQAQA